MFTVKYYVRYVVRTKRICSFLFAFAAVALIALVKASSVVLSHGQGFDP
jgi:hypothetical protein